MPKTYKRIRLAIVRHYRHTRRSRKLVGYKLRLYFRHTDESSIRMDSKPVMLEDIKIPVYKVIKTGILKLGRKKVYTDEFIKFMHGRSKKFIKFNHFDLEMDERLVFQKC
jgi:hypothetical protein